MIYTGPGFLAIVYFGSSPAPYPPPLPSVRSTGGDTRETEIERQLADRRGGGMGEEANLTTERKPGPL
jgi:hypothetical protein